MPKLPFKVFKRLLPFFFILILIVSFAIYFKHQKAQVLGLQDAKNSIDQALTKTKKELDFLKNQDQYKINQKLKTEVDNIHDLYKKTVSSYENLVDLKSQKQDTEKLEIIYAGAVKDLSDLKYADARNKIKDLDSQIQKILIALAPASPPTTNNSSANANVSVSSNLPANGHSRQQVSTDNGAFTLDIIAADLNTTRVIVDTASDGTCANDCPTLPLAAYATRSSAYAAINGTFFCPAEYPGCAGKVNSFDTLLMNKNKVYFNSDNNVYSTVPAVIFKDNWARFVGRSLEWGRDTSVDAVIAMQPMLISGGQIAYGGSDISKYNSRGARNFIAAKGSTAYIGTIYNATMSDSAKVLKALGMENALNLDEGGSTALWINGTYLAGPGRNIPNAILFVRK